MAAILCYEYFRNGSCTRWSSSCLLPDGGSNSGTGKEADGWPHPRSCKMLTPTQQLAVSCGTISHRCPPQPTHSLLTGREPQKFKLLTFVHRSWKIEKIVFSDFFSLTESTQNNRLLFSGACVCVTKPSVFKQISAHAAHEGTDGKVDEAATTYLTSFEKCFEMRHSTQKQAPAFRFQIDTKENFGTQNCKVLTWKKAQHSGSLEKLLPHPN